MASSGFTPGFHPSINNSQWGQPGPQTGQQQQQQQQQQNWSQQPNNYMFHAGSLQQTPQHVGQPGPQASNQLIPHQVNQITPQYVNQWWQQRFMQQQAYFKRLLHEQQQQQQKLAMQLIGVQQELLQKQEQNHAAFINYQNSIPRTHTYPNTGQQQTVQVPLVTPTQSRTPTPPHLRTAGQNVSDPILLLDDENASSESAELSTLPVQSTQPVEPVNTADLTQIPQKPENSWYSRQYAVCDSIGRVVREEDGKPKRKSVEQQARNNAPAIALGIRTSTDAGFTTDRAPKRRKRADNTKLTKTKTKQGKSSSDIDEKLAQSNSIMENQEAESSNEAAGINNENANKYTTAEMAELVAMFDTDDEKNEVEAVTNTMIDGKVDSGTAASIAHVRAQLMELDSKDAEATNGCEGNDKSLEDKTEYDGFEKEQGEKVVYGDLIVEDGVEHGENGKEIIGSIDPKLNNLFEDNTMNEDLFEDNKMKDDFNGNMMNEDLFEDNVMEEDLFGLNIEDAMYGRENDEGEESEEE